MYYMTSFTWSSRKGKTKPLSSCGGGGRQGEMRGGYWLQIGTLFRVKQLFYTLMWWQMYSCLQLQKVIIPYILKRWILFCINNTWTLKTCTHFLKSEETIHTRTHFQFFSIQRFRVAYKELGKKPLLYPCIMYNICFT